MARIKIANIADVCVSRIPYERTYDDPTIDNRVRKMYIKKGYGKRPKTPEEAKAIGQTNYNGLSSSFPSIRTYGSNRIVVAVDIMPTRYLIGQAMRDLVKEEQLSLEDILAMSPNMAGVSIIVPVKYKNEYCIIAQVKGKALGSGQVHGAAAAGNVSGKYVMEKGNPLIRSLKDECSHALIEYLEKRENQKFLLEKAGF